MPRSVEISAEVRSVLVLKWDTRKSVIAVAGTLPVARRRVIFQFTVFVSSPPCTSVPQDFGPCP